MFARYLRRLTPTGTTLTRHATKSFSSTTTSTAASSSARLWGRFVSPTPARNVFASLSLIAATATATTVVACDNSDDDTSAATLDAIVANLDREKKQQQQQQEQQEQQQQAAVADVLATSTGKHLPGNNNNNDDVIATWMQRFIAATIDNIIIQIITAVDTMILVALFGQDVTSKIGPLVVVGTSVSYFSMSLVGGKGDDGWFGKEGQTIGKKICGIRTVLDDGGEHGDIHMNSYFMESLGRCVFGIDLIIGLLDGNNRCLHNKWAGTVVVQV
jgi:hypothetical protein